MTGAALASLGAVPVVAAVAPTIQAKLLFPDQVQVNEDELAAVLKNRLLLANLKMSLPLWTAAGPTGAQGSILADMIADVVDKGSEYSLWRMVLLYNGMIPAHKEKVYALVRDYVHSGKRGAQLLGKIFNLQVGISVVETAEDVHFSQMETYTPRFMKLSPEHVGESYVAWHPGLKKFIAVTHVLTLPKDKPAPNPEMQKLTEDLNRFEKLNNSVLSLLHKPGKTVGELYQLIELFRQMVQLYLALFKGQTEHTPLKQIASASSDLTGGRSVAKMFLKIEGEIDALLKQGGKKYFETDPLPDTVDAFINKFDADKSSNMTSTPAENYEDGPLMQGVTLAELVNIVHQKGKKNMGGIVSSKKGKPQRLSVTVTPVGAPGAPSSGQVEPLTITVPYYDARGEFPTAVPATMHDVAMAFARNQLVHAQHHLFDPKNQAGISAYDNYALISMKLGVHSASIQYLRQPVQEGGMVQVTYTDSGSQYEPGSSMRIKALARAFAKAGFKVTQNGYNMEAISDKDHGASSMDELRLKLEFAIQAFSSTRDLDLRINDLYKATGKTEKQKEDFIDFLAGLISADGFLKRNGSTNAGLTADNLSRVMTNEEQRDVIEQMKFLGMKKSEIPADGNVGQRALDALNERRLLLISRGAVKVTPDGKLVKVKAYAQAAQVSAVTQILSRLEKATDTDFLNYRKTGVLAKMVQDFASRRSLGAIGQYEIHQLTLPLIGGEQLTFYALRDRQTDSYVLAMAALGEFFFDQPRLDPVRNKKLPHNQLNIMDLEAILTQHYILASERLKAWLKDQKMEMAVFEKIYHGSVFHLLQDHKFISAAVPFKMDNLYAQANENVVLSRVALGGTSTNHGAALGRAVINSPGKKADDFAGGILISDLTEPKDDASIKRSSGIVVTTGGPLSHAAIRSREHKKPGVILNGAQFAHNGLTFKVFKGEESRQEMMFKGRAIAYYGIADFTEETVLISDGDLVYLDGNAGVFYLIAKAGETTVQEHYDEYLAWKNSVTAKEPSVDALGALLNKIKDERLIKVIIRDLMMYSVLSGVDLEKILTQAGGTHPAMRALLFEFLQGETRRGIEHFENQARQYVESAQGWGLEQVYLELKSLIEQARGLYRKIQMANGKWDLGLTLDGLKARVEQLRAAGSQRLKTEQEKLRQELQSVKPEAMVNLIQLLRLERKLNVADMSLAQEKPKLQEQLDALKAKREMEVQGKVGRGILWKSEVKDRFARPLAGGKGAHSGEIQNALTTLQAAGVIPANVTTPLGFSIQPKEYELWQEAGKPASLDPQLQKTLLLAYRDLVMRQAKEILAFLQKDERSVDRIKEEIKANLERMLDVLDGTDSQKVIEAALEGARKSNAQDLKDMAQDQVSRSLRNRLAVLGAVAVRSSGLKEDSETEAMAGMRETVLNVIGGKRLFAAVLEVWGSGAEGILIEEMINARKSVLAFSVDPVAGKMDQMYVTAAFGLAKGLVDQTVESPDAYIVKKSKDFEILSSALGAKLESVVLDLESGGVKTVKGVNQSGEAALTDEQVQSVAQTVEALAQYFGFHVDEEASLDSDDRLVILQVRPITTLRESIELGREILSSQKTVTEILEANGQADQAMLGFATGVIPQPIDLEAPSTVSKEVGGINFNPVQLDLRRQGNRVEFNVPGGAGNPENLKIDGLTPFIFQVVPITNLPLILGYNEDDPMDRRREQLSAVN